MPCRRERYKKGLIQDREKLLGYQKLVVRTLNIYEKSSLKSVKNYLMGRVVEKWETVSSIFLKFNQLIPAVMSQQEFHHEVQLQTLIYNLWIKSRLKGDLYLR
jgi:hypothetical protein